MLEQLRKHMNWILWATLALIIVTFLFFGVYPSNTSGTTVARVNDDIISYEEWNRSYLNLSETYRQIFKDQFNEGLAKVLRNQALQELIQNRLLSQEAERVGIKISDDELRDSIRAIPAFNPGGKFDSRTYEFYLDRVNLTPAVFEATQRDFLRRQRLVRVIEDSVAVTDEDVAAALLADPKKKTPKEKDALRQQQLVQKRQNALNAFVAGLKQQAKIKIEERYAAL